MLYLILALRELGVKALVYIPKHGPIEEAFRANGIAYEIHRYASLRIADKGCIFNAITTIVRVILDVFQALVLGIKLRNKIDIIHSNSSLVFLGIFLKFTTGKPLVWHLREFGHGDYDLVFGMGRRLSGFCYAKADRVIAISDAMNSFFKENVYEGKNIVTIYNGVDDSSISCKFDSPALNSDNKIKIAIVGGISEGKNQIDLINAVQLISHKNFIVDVIGGGDQKYLATLKQSVLDSRMDDYVHFKGNKTNVGELLADYDIGVITSRNEAFGRVTIEYMLAGLAVIGSRAGANTELIDDGVNGLLYELGNPMDLACKLDKLLNNGEFRHQLARKAYEYAKGNYTARINGQKIYELYDQLA